MRSLEDLRRRAALGDTGALIELYQLEARAGSRPHLETLALYEWILEGDPLLGADAAFAQAVDRFEAVRDLARSPIAAKLGAARSLSALYTAAGALDLTIKIHWGGLANLDRDHSVVGTFELGARKAPVSAPVAQLVECLERLAQAR